jgi:hypothetical protein
MWIPSTLTLLLSLTLLLWTPTKRITANNSNNDEYPFYIIGAGYGRTGTHTLQGVFEDLGYGPTHHMIKVFKNREYDAWTEIETDTNETRIQENLKQIMIKGGYHSSVDYPSARHFKHLVKVFPKAKVILTIRENAQIWIKSARKSIFIFHECRIKSIFEHKKFFMCTGINLLYALWPPYWASTRMFDAMLTDHLGDMSDETLTKIYNQQIEDAKKFVPADKLLIYNVKQGWEPLCKFLGIDIPNKPFPQSNDSETFFMFLHILAAFGWIYFMLIVGGMYWIGVKKLGLFGSGNNKRKSQ